MASGVALVGLGHVRQSYIDACMGHWRQRYAAPRPWPQLPFEFSSTTGKNSPRMSVHLALDTPAAMASDADARHRRRRRCTIPSAMPMHDTVGDADNPGDGPSDVSGAALVGTSMCLVGAFLRAVERFLGERAASALSPTVPCHATAM